MSFATLRVGVKTGYALCPLLIAAAVGLPCVAVAQFTPLALQPGYEERRFSFALGPGVTWNVSKLDAYGPTFTIQLGYAIDEHWSVSVAPSWDMEIRRRNGRTTRENTLGTAFVVGYSFTPQWSLGGGYQISFANDARGDWKIENQHSVGLAPGYTGRIGARWLWTLGPTFGYDISSNEFSITADLLLGFDF